MTVVPDRHRRSRGRPPSRRQVLGLLGVAGTGAVASACVGPGTVPDRQVLDLAAVAAQNAQGQVSFAHWRGEDREILADLAAAFAREHPGASVQQNITTSDDFNSQALQRLRRGRIGDAFATFRGPQYASFVDAEVYADLTGLPVVDLYRPELIEAGRSGGRQYGLPYQVVLPMPLGNLDLFDAAGADPVPGDWDAFLGTCEALAGQDVTPIAWPGGVAGDAGQLFNSMVMNHGPVPDMCAQIETGDLHCTDDWFLAMLAQYQQLTPFFQDDPTGTFVEPAQQLFASGRAAMLATGSYNISSVRALGAEFPIDVVSPLTNAPGEDPEYRATFNATFILGVNNASSVAPAALAWVEFLSDPVNATAYADGTTQYSSVRGVEYSNADLRATAHWLAEPSLLAPRYQFVDADVRTAVEASCTQVVGGTPPEQAAEAAQRVVDERL